MSELPPVPIEDITPTFDGNVICLWYGAGGTGKTRAGGTIGKNGLIVSIGEGDMTLKSPGFHNTFKGNLPKIAYIREEYDSATGIFKKAEALDKLTDITDWFLAQPELTTMVLDDASFMNRFARNKALEFMKGRTQGGEASLDVSRRAKFLTAGLADYGKEMDIIEWYLITHVPLFRAARKSFIMLAHERHIFKKAQKQGESNVLDRIIPGFTGQTFPDAIQKYFDFVWRFTVKNGNVFRAATIGNQQYLAKTRWSGVFAEEEQNVNFLNIIRRMEESVHA